MVFFFQVSETSLVAPFFPRVITTLLMRGLAFVFYFLVFVVTIYSRFFSFFVLQFMAVGPSGATGLSVA